jgi:hypothetical protein
LSIPFTHSTAIRKLIVEEIIMAIVSMIYSVMFMKLNIISPTDLHASSQYLAFHMNTEYTAAKDISGVANKMVSPIRRNFNKCIIIVVLNC